jgi:septal ring factor EnvC (AmiA/AmiB activator)
MELVDLYVQKKDGLDALSNLVLASRSNTVYDTTGQAHFGDIAAKRAQLLAIGLVKQTDLADLDKEQTAWKAAKVEADKQAIEEKKEEAEQKRQAEEQAKKDAENEKKNAELLKQQQAQQKKAGGKAPADTSAGKLLPGSTSPAPSSSGQLLPPGALGGH